MRAQVKLNRFLFFQEIKLDHFINHKFRISLWNNCNYAFTQGNATANRQLALRACLMDTFVFT
jgi:hypothetical protein